MRTKKYLVGVSVIMIGIVLFAFFQKENSFVENKINSIEQQNTSEVSENSTSTFDEVLQTSNAEQSASSAELVIADQKISFDFVEGQTVYEAMQSLQSQNKISFTGKEYPALGFFVTSVGSLEQGNGKNLFYYINGEEASTGISTYKIKKGDIIEWKLK